MARDWKVASGLAVAEAVERLEWIDIAAETRDGLSIAWLGHACFLLRWKGISLVIDPVFRKWIGPFPRLLPLPRLEAIGRVDAVLVSHGHMDHLDERSIQKLETGQVLIPSKTAGFLGRELRGRCVGVELGQEFELGDLRVWVVPARHGGWRYPWQRGYFACGFVVSDGEKTVYATGDTAYGLHLGEIGKRWKIDTALLPIGAYAPQWFLKSRHLNPEEACLAASDLGAAEVIPFHFGTYRLSLEPMDEPMKRFAAEAARRDINWRLPVGL